MQERQLRFDLCRQVFAAHRDWIQSNASKTIGDLAEFFPQDQLIATLMRSTGRLYKLCYLSDDASAGSDSASP
jgi:hypothetical protein